MKLKCVDKKWLWRQAKAIETKLLKRDGYSMAAITIVHQLHKCIVASYIGEDVMVIDYDCYKRVREQLLAKGA